MARADPVLSRLETLAGDNIKYAQMTLDIDYRRESVIAEPELYENPIFPCSMVLYVGKKNRNGPAFKFQLCNYSGVAMMPLRACGCRYPSTRFST